MKKVTNKIALLGMLSLLTIGTISTSCSKSDDNGQEQSSKDTIDPAVGTYVGKLETYFDGYTQEWYDAVIIVTKVGPNKLKVAPKSGEAYSVVTPKVFTVETGAFFGENTKDIVSLTGSLEGFFNYYGSNKNISVGTDEQAATDIAFEFDGVKQ